MSREWVDPSYYLYMTWHFLISSRFIYFAILEKKYLSTQWPGTFLYLRLLFLFFVLMFDSYPCPYPWFLSLVPIPLSYPWFQSFVSIICSYPLFLSLVTILGSYPWFIFLVPMLGFYSWFLSLVSILGFYP